MEERWERYLEEGVQETPDLSFSTPSWAGASSRLDYSLGQPEPRHPTESESIPPGFTWLDRKTPEEQEAVGTYQTPAEEDAYRGNKMTIDEELGAEDVTTLGNDWFPPSESEVTEAVQNLINLQNLQGPMDVDQAPEERQYQIFNVEEADALGPYQTPGSPITAEEDWHLTHQEASPELRKMEDRYPDPRPELPVGESQEGQMKDQSKMTVQKRTV